MHRLHIFIFIIFCQIISGGSLVKAEATKVDGESPDTITWLQAYFPPVTIPSGPDAGLGFYDKITETIINSLPHYKHSFVTANVPRIIHEIKNEKRGCCASLYKTPEREQYTAFSIPVVLVLPNGIIVRKEDKELFSYYMTSDEEIKLTEILKDKNLMLGVAKGRKYSGGIDEILAAHGKEANILERTGEDVFKGLLDMLLMGRIEYLLGFPVEAQYLAQKVGRGDDIQFYPVAETQVEYTVGHVGCPDTEWGRKVIGEVDKILLNHRTTSDFLGYYENWLDEKTAKSYHKKALQFFKNDATQ